MSFMSSWNYISNRDVLPGQGTVNSSYYILGDLFESDCSFLGETATESPRGLEILYLEEVSTPRFFSLVSRRSKSLTTALSVFGFLRRIFSFLDLPIA